MLDETFVSLMSWIRRCIYSRHLSRYEVGTANTAEPRKVALGFGPN
jgi:hypothetical protein